MSFALHCLSGRNKGNEYPLPDHGEMVIGTNAKGDLLVGDASITSGEALIVLEGRDRTIKEVGARKDVWVNGERIRESALQEGDRIRVCGTNFMLITLTRFSPAFAEPGVKEAILQPQVALKNPGDANGNMSGTLRKEMTVVDLLQFLVQSGKSGVLTITNGPETGKVSLRNGHIYHAGLASKPALAPLRALYRLMAWKEGSFTLDPPTQRKVTDEIKESSDSVILDGVHQLDEFTRLEPDLPDRAARLRLAAPPFKYHLRDLPPEDLDVLQLVLRYGLFEAVIDNHAGNDLEACTRFVELMRKGFIQEERVPSVV